MNNAAVFLDRDGVINKDNGYVYRIDDFIWINGAKEAIKFLKEKGFKIFVVTNQSGISRGFYDENDVDSLHKFINSELSKHETSIDEFFLSPYHPEVKNYKYDHLSHLRKPETGMLELACTKWQINKKYSFLIGDQKTDMLCARNFGIKGFLFEGGNLYDFVSKLVKDLKY